MIYYIFDLDDTLLRLTNNEKAHLKNLFKFPQISEFDLIKNYRVISKRKQLKKLLQYINNPKIILTNANAIHAKLSLHNMDILDCFNSIIDRDMIRCLKPNMQAYLLTMKLNNIKDPYKCLFFDDQLPNLVAAKMIGWNTVYIGNIITNPYVDFSFNNIYDALIFFINTG